MHFPITIIDNFFDEPDRIVTFANSLQYHSRQKGDYWYGLRSKPLHEVDKGYFEWSSQKILRAFYKDETRHVCNTCFQKTPGIKNISNEGWIHTDKCLMAAIIYLDKDNFSGTNFYKSKTFGKEKFKNLLVLKYIIKIVLQKKSLRKQEIKTIYILKNCRG